MTIKNYRVEIVLSQKLHHPCTSTW